MKKENKNSYGKRQAMGMMRKGGERCGQFCGFQVSWCRVFKSAPVKWEPWVLEALMGLLDKRRNERVVSSCSFTLAIHKSKWFMPDSNNYYNAIKMQMRK